MSSHIEMAVDSPIPAVTGDFSGSVLQGETVDYERDWAELRGLRKEAAKNPEMVPKMFDFAARPGGSLMAKSYALDDGAYYLAHAVEDGTSDSIELHGLYDQLSSLAPAYFGPNAPYRYEEYGDIEAGASVRVTPQGHADFFWQIAVAEEADYQLVAPTPTNPVLQLDTLKGRTPELPCILLAKLIGTANSGDITNLSPKVAKDALAVALDFRGAEFQRIIGHDEHAGVSEFTRLWRLSHAGGEEHKEPIDFLYRLPATERNEYARTFNRLYDVQEKLDDFFPGIDLKQAARSLVANALFAVQGHVQNGLQSDISLPLRRLATIQARFTGNQPIELLNTLVDRLDQAHARMQQSTPEVAVHEADFTIFNFPPLDHTDPYNVTQYIRPEGGSHINYRYEYGGTKMGVLASIDWRLDKDLQGEPRAFHKAGITDKSFSIRLDRDVPQDERNQRDPSSPHGQLSLDIGSLMGKGFGRDIAVLLAWGNKLRSEAIGAPLKLNHQAEYVDQTYGQADKFAALAQARRNRLLALAGHSVAGSLRTGAAAALSAMRDDAAS